MVYSNKIRAFYKQIKFNSSSYLTAFSEEGEIRYFRKDLPKICPINFTFSEQDQVKKIGNN